MDKRKKEKSRARSSRTSGKLLRVTARKKIIAKFPQHGPFIAFDEWYSNADDEAFRNL